MNAPHPLPATFDTPAIDPRPEVLADRTVRWMPLSLDGDEPVG